MSDVNRRDFLAGVAATVAASAGLEPVGAQTPPVAGVPTPHARATGVAPLALAPLPLGAIQPRGWLLNQLRLQRDGLTGHLDEFWPDVADSQWFGGKAEGWERAPYWMDGAIPLAWMLDDAPMKARLTKYVDYILAHQRADGWYHVYPEDAVAKRYDMWAILLANKVLCQYHDATGDARVLDAVASSLRALAAGLDRTPLYDWGRTRWFEGLISIFYVYERKPEPWLLDLARKLRAQGVDCETQYTTDEDMKVPTPRRGLWKWTKHVVNAGMSPKAAALSWRLDQRVPDRAWPRQMIEFLDRYHGQVNGMFTGDETLSGKNPTQGTELCSVVEFMYSLETLVSVFGDAPFADRLERVAYNALPATMSPDLWTHQYDQQVNQVQCTINPNHGWSSNGAEANLFGLEPNYGCCTSNMHQGWPKFAAHLWMRTADGGFAAVAYAPCKLTADAGRRTADGGNGNVEITCDTGYPFRETVGITVHVDAPARFPLVLRIPAWADGATVKVGDGAATRARPGTWHRVEREWRGSTTVTLHFPMKAKVTTRYNNNVAIERGPLVYSLKIAEEWKRVNADKPHRELPHADYEVRPTSPWNYGIVMEKGEAQGLTFEERPIGDKPFSPEGAGMVAQVQARRVPQWGLVRDWAGEISSTDAIWADASKAISKEPIETVALIPYGCTNIRVTEFPQTA
ncbi:MAG: glycoside hydrolase family 127 protein [Gemmatimonadaceae bacterium]|nr:glycoside hydrolase family 127 protein [Gemmatimonadaceae bacterium]